uniref:Large ribosomal subunit protein mL54 n=1 Tax=Tetraselmis sp. GSL018 TaxID=582737 RepID=A0A061SFU4_9CHLO|mmetsp:Transcript_1089/g.2618  ORF Transcript_1089/g.2618 Transcript_1089/m.2618 type:complete len:115 (-) Transcript_1089:550-894(-)
MLRSTLNAASRLPVRGLAPKKGGKKAEDTSSGTATGHLSATEVTGCNIFKDGSDPPILPDDQYPSWLWELATPGPTLNELERKGPDSLEPDELKRYVKLKRRDSIRRNNAMRSK